MHWLDRGGGSLVTVNGRSWGGWENSFIIREPTLHLGLGNTEKKRTKIERTLQVYENGQAAKVDKRSR